MTRIMVICEGQTEKRIVESFNNIHIFQEKSLYVSAININGNVNIDKVLRYIKNCYENYDYITTFFDYYGIDSEFPGVKESKQTNNIADKQDVIHKAFESVVNTKIETNKDRKKFIPYIQMHETEALFFSNIQKMVEIMDINNNIHLNNSLTQRFEEILNPYNSPEEINNTFETSPSHRIINTYNDVFKKHKNTSDTAKKYHKVSDGLLIFKDIGIDEIRSKCKLFDQWINTMENL